MEDLDYNPFRDLARLGVPDLLRDAAQRLESDGWTQGVTIDPEGRLDALAAILQAAGASHVRLNETVTEREWISAVPQIKRPLVLKTLDLLEASTGWEINAWNDLKDNNARSIVAEFRRLADRISRA